MKLDKFEKLYQLSEVLYLRELRKIGSVLQEEARITSGLRSLDEQDEAVADGAVQLAEYHRLGADISWNRWSSQMRSTMNSQLAQLRVQKAAMMSDVTKAFGRREAIAELGKSARDNAMMESRKEQVERLNHDVACKARWRSG